MCVSVSLAELSGASNGFHTTHSERGAGVRHDLTLSGDMYSMSVVGMGLKGSHSITPDQYQIRRF